MQIFRLSSLFVPVAVGIALSGCTPQAAPPAADNSVSAAAGSPSGASSPMAAAPQGIPEGVPLPQSAAPSAPNMGTGAKLTATPALDLAIARLSKGKDKKALAGALKARGDAHLYDDAAAPRVKYPAALKDYNRALKLDPNNKGALEAKNTIVDIYKMMGRPVPTA
jgi:tetratricopeptide (TPR) repeat protein